MKKGEHDLHQLNQRGWIPGPKETETLFLDRIEQLNHFFSYPPPELDLFLTDVDWEGAQAKTKVLFDFAPDWMVAHYSDENLFFFQGAATWLIQDKERSIPTIQLKTKFQSGAAPRLHFRDEVLSHEAVHAARMEFEEPLFEEIFAYRTSSKWWRRWLGPLFQTPFESYLFIALAFVPLAVELLTLFWPFPFLHWLNVVPAAFLTFLIVRLAVLQITLSRALHKLVPFLKEKKKGLATAFRLTDAELFRFAFRSEQVCRAYVAHQKSLRWTLLKKNYFQ